MTRRLPFTKMQGTGNDYIYINGFEEQVSDPGQLARRMADRHFGVGGDGLVLILPSATADVRMRMFNADGSEAEMCGNASRCVAKYVYDHGIVRKEVLTLETGTGNKLIRLECHNGVAVGATVDMGEPLLFPQEIPVNLLPTSEGQNRYCVNAPLEIDGVIWHVTAVSMGNPHIVTIVDDPEALDLPVIGPLFENNAVFPKRINTEFVRVISRSRIAMRVWERGAGETLACGTGACAAVVACVLNGLTERKVDVELRGGSLHIDWDEASNHIYMTGPAVTVFTGVYEL